MMCSHVHLLQRLKLVEFQESSSESTSEKWPEQCLPQEMDRTICPHDITDITTAELVQT